jgi:hypothetical protein
VLIDYRTIWIALLFPLLAAAQQPVSVPDAVIEDFSNILTVTDSGFDQFSGNMGAINKNSLPYGAILIGRTSGRPAMTFRWSFSGQPDLEAYSGVFFSLFGLTDTMVSYDLKTVADVAFPEHSLNLNRVDGALAEPGGPRSYLTAGVSLIYQGTAPLDLRLELKDSAGGGRFARFALLPSANRQTIVWDFRANYAPMAPDLDLTQAKVLSIVVERNNEADNVHNPDTGTLIVDRLWFTPNQAATEPTNQADLLDLAGRRSCQYFIDWSSRKTASFGIPQDRSTFADLLTVGGIGFALPCYAIAAERGWIARDDAAQRTVSVLRVIADPTLYCANPVGCLGYRGWLYHFLGPDGRRKQNYYDPRNTVEVSTIDTTLALAGTLAAQSYFNTDTGVEPEIRALSQQFYDNVDWTFMIEPKSNRFYYGWKPNEVRDNTQAEFLWPDADGKGDYSSFGGQPQVIDYYTDEGLLMTLLALGSTRQQVPADVYCAPQQVWQNGLVKTWPGSLFTFFFARAFFATEQLALPSCPGEQPVDWLANSRLAFQDAIQATAASPATWGISAAASPSDGYQSYGLPALAVATAPAQDGTVTYYGMSSAAAFGADLAADAAQALGTGWTRGHWHHRFGLPDAFNANALQAFPAAATARAWAKDGTTDGTIAQRGNASKGETVWLKDGFWLTVPILVGTPGFYQLTSTTSSDNSGLLATVTVSVDGIPVGAFQPPDTRPAGGAPGSGWNQFADSTLPGQIDLLAGSHVIRFDVAPGNDYGMELDLVRLDPVVGTDVRPWVDRALFAIDQGPAGLHLENARSGLIWALMKANPNIQRAATVLGPPPPPVLTSPANGTTGALVAPTLVWDFSAGAASYDVYFGTSSTPSLVTNTTGTSYTPGALTSGVTYYWQIVARNIYGSSGSGQPWSFTTGVPPTGSRFVAVSPCRIADTRNPPGPFGRPALVAGSTRSFPIPQSGCGIPATALAYSLNLTVVPAGPLNYVTLWPSGQPQPLVSTLNSFSGNVVANAAVVPAGSGGAVSVFASDQTDVILDIDGYFTSAGSPPSYSFYAAAPCRVADTRNPTGQFGGPSLFAGQARDFPVPSGPCGIPATASAYSLNVTAVPDTAFLGYLTTWPTGSSRPLVSTLNSWTGRVVANAALVPAGSNGSISVFVTDPADVFLDIDGYFGQPGAAGALSFYPVPPCRVADTRNDWAPLGGPEMDGGTTRAFAIPASGCAVPSTAVAYSLNVTVVPDGPLSYLTAWPTGSAQPFVSTLNSFDGSVVANAAIVPAGTSGAISIYVTGPTHVILDINGYFAP